MEIPGLRAFWERAAARRAGRPAPADPARDKLLLDALEVPLEETAELVYREGLEYEELERWVLARNGGEIEPVRLARLAAALSGGPPPPEVERRLREVDRSAPVLDDGDLRFWDEHGYVVLHDAVPPDGCRDAARAVWDHLGADPADAESWYGGPRDRAIMLQLFDHPALRANRRSPRIHKAFAQLWGTPDLWTTFDRVSFNPPERPGWPFPGPRLHWDLDEVAAPVPFGVQGLLYLTDTAADQGAFTCVPGFHRLIDPWLAGLPRGADPYGQDLDALGAVPIPGAAGDLVIWHQALPHGSSPNRAARPRIVQYVYMYPG